MPKSFSLTTPGFQTNIQSNSTGQQPVTSDGVATLIASIDTRGVGNFSINGFVNTGALTDLIIAIALVLPSPNSPGTSVNRLVASAGDFAVISNMLNSATAQPQMTTAGNSFYADMDLRGRATRIDIYAKSTTASTVVVIDATGAGANVG
jgi:hypothetical protein